MTVQEALIFATKAHGDQRERTGTPYIFHCVRVAQKIYSDDIRVIALLHDVLEDTNVTREELFKAGCTEYQVDTIETLTRRAEEHYDYQLMLDRVKKQYWATVIKLADIEDHLDVIRDLSSGYVWSDKDALRIKRYMDAHQQLKRALQAFGGS